MRWRRRMKQWEEKGFFFGCTAKESEHYLRVSSMPVITAIHFIINSRLPYFFLDIYCFPPFAWDWRDLKNFYWRVWMALRGFWREDFTFLVRFIASQTLRGMYRKYSNYFCNQSTITSWAQIEAEKFQLCAPLFLLLSILNAKLTPKSIASMASERSSEWKKSSELAHCELCGGWHFSLWLE